MGLCASACLHIIEDKKKQHEDDHHENHNKIIFGDRSKNYETRKRTSIVSLNSSSSSLFSKGNANNHNSKVMRRPSMVKSNSIPSIVVEVAPSRFKPNEVDSKYFKGSLQSLKESQTNPSYISLDSLLKPPSSQRHSHRRRDSP